MQRNIFAFLLLLCFTGVYSQHTFVQKGQASFYADKFEGRKTASGEIYAHNKLTAAHLTLPFGTMVKVTNLKNQKTVVVRINDRGPFVQGRIIDLSKKAAEQLDFIKHGLVNVKIEVVGKVDIDKNESEDKTEPTDEKKEENKSDTKQEETKPNINSTATSDEIYQLTANKRKPTGIGVQIGSFREMVNMLAVCEEIQKTTNEPVYVHVAGENGNKLYRIIVGEFTSEKKAEALKNKLRRIHRDAFIIHFANLD